MYPTQPDPIPNKPPVNQKWVEQLSPISRFVAEQALKESKKKMEEINNKNNIK